MSSEIHAPDGVADFWSGGVPDWVHALATACDRKSQAHVARQIGYSPTVVNQVLKRKYPGNMRRVEDAVRATIMRSTVECPELGEIALAECREYQARPFSSTNAQRVRLWKACRNCELNLNREN